MQVYLGKWQETDVAVKVLLDMQHLAPNSQVQPQDPATLEPWKDSPQANMPSAEQQGDGKLTAQGLQGITDVEGSDDCQSQAEEGGAGEAAIKTLEREVGLHLCAAVHVATQPNAAFKVVCTYFAHIAVCFQPMLLLLLNFPSKNRLH